MKIHHSSMGIAYMTQINFNKTYQINQLLTQSLPKIQSILSNNK